MLLVLCLLADFSSIYAFFECPFGGICCGVFFLGMTVFIFLQYTATSQPFIIIDSLRLQNDARSFFWTQIKKVSLLHPPHTKHSPLYLKLELGSQEHWINLRFVSDSVRRRILDLIEYHIPVQYEGCRYKSNEETIAMGTMILVFILLCITLLFLLIGASFG